ncbi:hypothetical protein N7478_008353 [Penicillium angulare]|uniref:uncharacterized protein n=1 Tax=Penicillium angulare TaxID=116970 RepID=UPI002540B917|nr:uncharacterized protein N7478_008353 [Penicillium angulare]KAJ5273228.1 hypothetical protein N7478_008353 [Penicillium angulare]
MDIESCVELPDGHLVNLSPRPQRKTQQYQAYRAHYTTNKIPGIPTARNSHRVPPEEPRVSPDAMFHKEKTTKLPLPKAVPDRAREQRNQTPSPTGIPKPSSAGISSGASGEPSTDRNRDPWRKIRDRFEKESPLTQRSSYVRTREGDVARSRAVVEQPKYEKYPAQIAVDDQTPSRPSNTRSAIPNPNANISRAAPNARQDPPRNPESSRWRAEKEQQTNREARVYIAQKVNTTDTSDSSSPSRQSISPVSAEESVTDCDWEDRFVVHMPSAKDPNPPTMTADQIAEYQKSIERVRRSGRRMVDPNTRPSPRNSLGDGKRDPPTHRERRRASAQYHTYDGRNSDQPDSDTQDSPPEPDRSAATNSQLHPSQAQGHYYSPDEIGKNRISTIWEESPTKAKEKRGSHIADGSFLGCKEINGPGTKNPDEILLFASGEDSATLQPRPLAIGAKKRLKEKASRAARKSADKVALEEEWSQVSQNSKHAQCLKQSSVTMCQEPKCAEQEVATPESKSSKENSRPTESKENTPVKTDDGRGDDDVFIITPTITRTMIPTPTPEKSPKTAKTISILKAQGLRRPGGTGHSGTGEAVKAVRAKAQVISTLSGLRPATNPAQVKSTVSSLAASKSGLTNLPMTKKKSIKEGLAKDEDTKPTETATPEKEKDKEKPEKTSNSIRGFIRTSGLAKSTSMVRSPTGSLATIIRNGTESLRHRAESFRNGSGSLVSRKSSSSPVSQISPPSRDNSESSRSDRSFRSAKETPPSSTKPSPVKAKTRQPRVSLEKPSPKEKPPVVEPKPPPKKASPPLERNTPPPEQPKLEKLTISEKASQAERLSRQERLERFKEQARARRATKVVEIAELDGHQVSGATDTLQANITDVRDDLGKLDPIDKDDDLPKGPSNTVALSMIFEIVLVAVTNMHKFGLQTTDSAYAKFIILNILSMTQHCYQVFGTIYQTVSVYQATGTWPKPKNDKAISRFMVETLQAAVYLVILGFGALVLGRTAGYLFLIASWMLWLAKPFTWTFQCFTRALIT